MSVRRWAPSISGPAWEGEPIKIGSLNLTIARPDDLDEQLLATTGCSADEVRGHLAGPCIASSVAGALLPFVAADKPVRHTLAEAIAKAGVDKIRVKVLALYQEGPASGKARR